MSGGVTCELVAWAAARVDWLREGLLGWFERFGRCFPWREPGRSAYEVTVAEILLQRTTAAQVAQVYPDFLRRYPAWDSLAGQHLRNSKGCSGRSGSGARRRGRSSASRAPSRSGTASCRKRAGN